jgi:hypothetical protein
VASQSTCEGGLGPPDIDSYPHSNCLLKIIDLQSCQKWKEKTVVRKIVHKKGWSSLRSYLSEECISRDPYWEAETRSYFKH